MMSKNAELKNTEADQIRQSAKAFRAETSGQFTTQNLKDFRIEVLCRICLAKMQATSSGLGYNLAASSVIPAQGGIQRAVLNYRLRGNDGRTCGL